MSSSPPTEAPVLTGPISLDEFLSWGVTDVQYELVDGWVVVNPTPNFRHQQVATNLGWLLRPACPSGHTVLSSPIDWVLRVDPPLVRQPDVVVTPIQDGPRLTAAPLLAIEVLSPGGNERDLVTKRRQYAAAGLRHYWVVDPEVPAVVVFAGTDLHEVARAVGPEPLAIDDPVAVTLVAADLLGPTSQADCDR